VLVAGFLGLQALAISAIDEKVLLERLREALTSEVLTEETDPTSPFGHTGLKFDMFSECIALGTNLLNSDSLFLSVLLRLPIFDCRASIPAQALLWQ